MKPSIPPLPRKRRLLFLAALLVLLLFVYLVVKPQRRVAVTAQERQAIARSESIQRFDSDVAQLRERIRADPGNPRWRQELAARFLGLRLWMDVAETLEDAVRAGDTHPLTLNTLGEAYWNLGNREQAILWFKQNVKQHPREVAAYVRLSNAYVDIGEEDWARRVLRHIPADEIGPRLLVPLALAYEKAGDYAQARSLCARQLQTDPEDLQALWIIAKGQLRSGQWKQAEKTLEKALRRDPNRAEFAYFLGVCRAALSPGKEAETTIPLWEKAVRLNPGMGLAYYDLGRAYERAGRLQDAVRAYLRAYETPPASVKALSDMARVYDRLGNRSLAHKARGLYWKHKGNTQGAIREFEARWKLEPDSELAALDLADAYQTGARPQEALRVLQQALPRVQKPAALYFRMATLYKGLQRVQEEMDCLQRMLQIEPKQAAVAYRELCRIAMERTGEYDKAEQYIQKAIALDSREPDFYYTQGLLYALRAASGGRMEKAMDAFRQALTLQPTHVDSIYQLGILLQKAGRWEEAASHFRAAISLMPTFGEAYLKLYQVYQKQGKTTQAATLMRLYQDYQRASADREMLFRRTRANMKDSRAAFALATFYLRNGDLTAAEQEFQRMAALQPDSPLAHARLAAIYAAQGRVQDEQDELSLASRAKQTVSRRE
ncbi:MAG TPA: tetratricopeptide repeat protein [Chthonomonadaceae bacterium]|nr:tetratricopeptide repeat protein [Chthonomonadaceae bacterium]